MTLLWRCDYRTTGIPDFTLTRNSLTHSHSLNSSSSRPRWVRSGHSASTDSKLFMLSPSSPFVFFSWPIQRGSAIKRRRFLRNAAIFGDERSVPLLSPRSRFCARRDVATTKAAARIYTVLTNFRMAGFHNNQFGARFVSVARLLIGGPFISCLSLGLHFMPSLQPAAFISHTPSAFYIKVHTLKCIPSDQYQRVCSLILSESWASQQTARTKSQHRGKSWKCYV